MPGREAVPGTGHAGESDAGMSGREGVPGAWYANGTDMQAPDPAGQPGPVRQGRDGRDVRGPETEGVMAASEESYGEAAFARNGRIGEQVTREVPKSEPEPEVLTGRPRLKENQRDLFMGFTSIGNLEEQIAAAIWQAENRKDDRTSRSGNILILGAHGCGKTTIATGIAKAIAEDKGTHSVKMARIYAADLNRKDIAATIAKIAGGVLIVE
jgi:ABC-type glutathione transport system ATPase component